MKRVMLTTATMALLTSGTALAQAHSDVQEAADTAATKAEAAYDTTKKAAKDASTNAKNATEKALTATRTVMSDAEKAALSTLVVETQYPVITVGDYTYLANRALTGGRLLGAEVTGVTDEKIATVDDVILSEDGTITWLILSHGGFFDIGDKDVAIALDRFTLTPQEDGEPGMHIALTEAGIENAAEFKEDALTPDQMMLSEFLDTEVQLATSEESVKVHDIVFEADGGADRIVFVHGDFAGLGGDKFAMTFEALNVAEGDGSYYLDLTPERTVYQTTFVYDIDDVDASKRPQKNNK